MGGRPWETSSLVVIVGLVFVQLRFSFLERAIQFVKERHDTAENTIDVSWKEVLGFSTRTCKMGVTRLRSQLARDTKKVAHAKGHDTIEGVNDVYNSQTSRESSFYL